MRVLITGVTGFIGYHLSKALIEKGYDVYGLVRFVSTGRRLPDGIKFIYGDLTDYHSIIKVVEEVMPHLVFHLAALTPVSESFNIPRTYMETNVIGTINLVEALRKKALENLELFVFAGTTEMYDSAEPISPKSEFSPTSPYAVSKISAYYYLEYMRKTYNLPYVVVVPTNTYGRAFVGQRHFVIEKLITEMLQGREKIIMGRLDTERDFMFREDHVSAYLSILEKKEKEEIIGKLFTFGTGKYHTIAEVAKIIAEITGWRGEILPNVYVRPNEPKRIVVDYSEAKRVLGWEPKYDIRSGLERAVSEWKQVLGV